MKIAALFPLFGAFAIACSSSDPTTPVIADAGVADSSAPQPTADAGTDASSGDAAPACATATCTTEADCHTALGGITGCWQCTVGCCVGVTKGQDPSAACTSQATACQSATCDGNGGCAKQNLPAKTVCGTVCNNLNEADQKVAATCDGSGLCRIDFAATPSFTNCPNGMTCTGASDQCGSCPASGCTVSCATNGPAPSCP